MIDAHLARFLTEQGIQTTPWDVEPVREQLKKAGFELVHELKKYSENEVHTFKLVKVYSQTSLEIPIPYVSVALNE